MSYQATMNAELDKMRANGLNIDGDNAYKRDLLHAVTGALAYGKQRSAPPPAGHWLEPFYEMGKAEADERDAARSLPVGVPDASELQRVIYSADAAAKRMLDADSFWRSEIAAIRVEFERFMRKAAASPTVKESLSVAPTVKAEQVQCKVCGDFGSDCDECGAKVPSLPAAGSAVPLGEVEIPDIVATFDGLYLVPIKPLQAGQHLMTVAQCIRIQEQLRAALKAGQGEAVACAAVVKRMADAEPYLGDKVHYGCDPADDYKAYRVELYIPTPASAPEPFEVAAAKWLSAVPPASADAVSVPRELLRQGADLLDAHSSGPSIEQNIADDFRTLLASHGRGEA